MTLELFSEKHQRFTNEWRGLPLYQSWVDTIKQTVWQQQNLKITSCMCLGLGSFSGSNACNRSLAQLVVFESIFDLLKTKYNIEHVYLQEPRFSELDLEFLRAKGYKVLYTPESDDHMTEETFLFTPGAEQRVVNSSREAAFPGLYIMNDMTEQYQYHVPPLGPSVDEKRAWQEKLPASEQKARRNLLAAFMNQRAARPLPDPKWHHPLNYLIYYKPDAEIGIRPWEWEVKEEEWLTREQAEEIWRKKGLMPPKSTDQGISRPEDDHT